MIINTNFWIILYIYWLLSFFIVVYIGTKGNKGIYGMSISLFLLIVIQYLVINVVSVFI